MTSYSTSNTRSYSTPEISSAADARDAYANCSTTEPVLGMPMHTATPQQSTTMQAVLTPANTVAHRRSSPQQPINEGATGQPVFPQVDSAQLLQTLNQLTISS
jgi:hypothetical protein